MPQDNDCRLLAEVASGNQVAFSELYDRFSNMLWTVALRMLQDETEAEDVLQDTFMYIWKKAGSYNSELSQPSTWMCLILRNRCLDRLRSRQRREKLITAVCHAAPSPKQSAVDLVGTTVVLRELGVQAREAMVDFPEIQRRAMELAYFTGHSHSEIAEVLSVPLGTVKTMIRQGLIFLRGRIGDQRA